MRLRTMRTAISIFILIAFIGGTWATTFTAATLQPTNPQKKKEFKPQNREKRPHQREGKGFKVKKGSEVAAKVKKLKGSNKDVGAALKLFEDKKRTPKVDASFSLNGSLGPAKAALNGFGRPFLSKLSFAQQSAIVGTNI